MKYRVALLFIRNKSDTLSPCVQYISRPNLSLVCSRAIGRWTNFHELKRMKTLKLGKVRSGLSIDRPVSHLCCQSIFFPSILWDTNKTYLASEGGFYSYQDDNETTTMQNSFFFFFAVGDSCLGRMTATAAAGPTATGRQLSPVGHEINVDQKSAHFFYLPKLPFCCGVRLRSRSVVKWLR